MIIVDVNLLLYAYDQSSRFHAPARSWWESKLSTAEIVGLPWTTLLAFIRISTNTRILERPFSLNEAIDHVGSWLDRPMVQIVMPDNRHWEVLNQLLLSSNAPGNYVPDTHLAVLAIENGATLCSSDRDFARFKGLSWVNPLEKMPASG
ncbi:MAG: type II toxin-antitoxin system VapC family toxin [Nitrospiria bacterium]